MEREEEIERNLGPQPLAEILSARGLRAPDLVAASAVPMTHKMVARAVKGRRLSANTKRIVLDALLAATGENFSLSDLFNY